MKTDTLVEQRLEELEKKANVILANKKFYFTDEEGVDYFKVDTPSFKAWATSVLNLLQRVFREDSIHYRQFDETYRRDPESDLESSFNECNAILQAAKEDYKGGYLFNVRGLVQAEVFNDVLEQADELLKAGYKDPACVVAGVALETTLKELCTRNNIAHNKLDRMNADLSKAGVYNMGMQKQVTAWAERRNKAAHGDWNAYSNADVEDMIRGVTRLIAEYL
jgi:HEPN domain-containing protein